MPSTVDGGLIRHVLPPEPEFVIQLLCQIHTNPLQSQLKLARLSDKFIFLFVRGYILFSVAGVGLQAVMYAPLSLLQWIALQEQFVALFIF